jgi:hypothetical protein
VFGKVAIGNLGSCRIRISVSVMSVARVRAEAVPYYLSVSELLGYVLCLVMLEEEVNLPGINCYYPGTTAFNRSVFHPSDDASM